MNRQSKHREFERRGKQRETERKEGRRVIAGKGGSLVRHYPQSTPQFLGQTRERERPERKRQTNMDGATSIKLCHVFMLVFYSILTNFSPSLQLSTSGLFTLAGSTEREHRRQHRHGSHTISPYTPRMTNPLSPCHRAELTL